MIGVLYFLIIIIVVSISSIAGISGGVVLRPIFDFIGYHDVTEIAFFSGTAVLAMAVSSTIKQLTMGTEINFKIVFTLAIGALSGGFLGQVILSAMTLGFDENMVQIIQGVLSILSLIFVLAFTRDNVKNYKLRGTLWYALAGLGLGTFATILAIGGGPINVIVFVLLFGITFKESAVYSITTIFFAQAARVGTMLVDYGPERFNLWVLAFTIPAAIIGGIIGGRLNVKFSEEQIKKVFKFVVIGTILINVWNVIDFTFFNGDYEGYYDGYYALKIWIRSYGVNVI